jgi:hypothetical protein
MTNSKLVPKNTKNSKKFQKKLIFSKKSQKFPKKPKFDKKSLILDNYGTHQRQF